jgi:ribosome-binding protein aMBF1 (putative translation factor)
MMGEMLDALLDTEAMLPEELEPEETMPKAKSPKKRVRAPRDPAKLKAYQDKWRAKQKKANVKKGAKQRAKNAKPKKKGPQPRYLRGGMLRTGNFTWGKKVAKARQAKGWTQEELAVFVGIKQPHMCNCERGTFKPSAELRIRIETLLGILRPSRAKTAEP